MNRVYIDVETTGLDPRTCSIWQIAGSVISELGEESFDFKLRPYKGETISEEASIKTGMTQEDLEKFPDQSEAYEKFISLLNKHGIGRTYSEKAIFIGYNSSFDMDFIRDWFEYNGDTKFGYRFFWPDLDVARIAAFILVGQRSNIKSFKLTELYKYLFHEEFDDAHNALADIQATRRILNYCTEKYLSPKTNS